mmetsp:Transcript_3911/g.11329  ORF Transcript_3911/g.11329 Transcript_3911/m.11329 type:complete len:278 (-) Transcript_3911:253-1086(-)
MEWTPTRHRIHGVHPVVRAVPRRRLTHPLEGGEHTLRRGFAEGLRDPSLLLVRLFVSHLLVPVHLVLNRFERPGVAGRRRARYADAEVGVRRVQPPVPSPPAVAAHERLPEQHVEGEQARGDAAEGAEQVHPPPEEAPRVGDERREGRARGDEAGEEAHEGGAEEKDAHGAGGERHEAEDDRLRREAAAAQERCVLLGEGVHDDADEEAHGRDELPAASGLAGAAAQRLQEALVLYGAQQGQQHLLVELREEKPHANPKPKPNANPRPRRPEPKPSP